MAIASLPMYDLAFLRAVTDDWWTGLAKAFRREGIGEVPEKLERGRDSNDVWSDRGLLLSQCCGFDLTHDAARLLRPVATPCYAAYGCDGPLYRSVVVVREEAPAKDLKDLQGLACAVNGRRSHSGWNALRHALAPLAGKAAFFSEVVESGGHAASLKLVQCGHADVAAVDCVTYALLQRHKPTALFGLRVLSQTASAPGLPYVTIAEASSDFMRRLRAAINRALADPTLEATRADLLIVGAEVLPSGAYERIIEMETLGRAVG